jgi:hypothetical protein
MEQVCLRFNILEDAYATKGQGERSVKEARTALNDAIRAACGGAQGAIAPGPPADGVHAFAQLFGDNTPQSTVASLQSAANTIASASSVGSTVAGNTRAAQAARDDAARRVERLRLRGGGTRKYVSNTKNYMGNS